MMTMDVVRPDMNVVHTMTVASLHDTGKKFSTKEGGMRQKWIAKFTTGYEAEVTPPVGEAPSGFIVGKPVSFKITFRGDRGDTVAEAAPVSQPPANYALAPNANISMGEDYFIVNAMLAASHLLSGTGANINDVVTCADDILVWMRQKKDGF